MKTMRRFICRDCENEFFSDGTYARRCPRCREQRRRKKKGAAWAVYRKRRVDGLTIEEFMRECEAYNRAHGTELNYGDYDRLKRCERGELTVEVKL